MENSKNSQAVHLLKQLEIKTFKRFQNEEIVYCCNTNIQGTTEKQEIN